MLFPVYSVISIANPQSVSSDFSGDNFYCTVEDEVMVMVFDRALSSDEIKAIYDSQKPAGVGTMDLRGLASILDAIEEILKKIKSLF